MVMRLMTSKKSRVIALCGILLGAIVYSFTLSAGSSNGFDLSNSILPPEQIISGGPPRDGIPAISDPRLIAADQVDYLKPTDRVVGISLKGQSRAYPIAILNWHEIVNDEIDGRRLAITYCPLCGTAVAFDATIDGSPTDFGVSGLLYNNDVLLYDRETESLWSQIMSEAISGERVGTKLIMLPLSHTTWRDWLAKHPDTLVLSEDTGYSRDYQRNPYAKPILSSSSTGRVNPASATRSTATASALPGMLQIAASPSPTPPGSRSPASRVSGSRGLHSIPIPRFTRHRTRKRITAQQPRLPAQLVRV
jgi:hypothetical protein